MLPGSMPSLGSLVTVISKPKEKMSKMFGKIKGYLISAKAYAASIIVLALAIVFWQFAVNAFRIQAYILPSPSLIFESFVTSNIRWGFHLYITLSEILIGFLAGAATGIALGILITYSNAINKILYPYILFLQLLPKVAVAPIFLIWFGFGLLPKVAITSIMTFFPMVVAIASGLQSTPPELIMLSNSLHATKWQIFKKIRLPNSLPYVFDGMKVSMTLAVVGALIGEFVAGDQGIGFVIVMSSHTMDTAASFAGILLISVAGIFLYGITLLAERLAVPWYWIPRQEERLKSTNSL